MSTSSRGPTAKTAKLLRYVAQHLEQSPADLVVFVTTHCHLHFCPINPSHHPYAVLENSPKKACALIGYKSCLYN